MTQYENAKMTSKMIRLVNLAEINFLICEKIQKNEKLKNSKFLILTSNNCFSSAIGILHSLLSSTTKEELKIQPLFLIKKQNEEDKNKFSVISNIDKKNAKKLYRAFLKDYPKINYFNYQLLNSNNMQIGDKLIRFEMIHRLDNGTRELKKIKEKFEKNNFHLIRHQTVAHKNCKVDEIDGVANYLIKPQYISELSNIIKDLKVSVCFWFHYEIISNNNSILLEELKQIKVS